MAPQPEYETDRIPTSAGDLAITFLGHGSLQLGFAGLTIYVDPFGKVADYSKLPEADLVLATHDHFDHFDGQALAAIRIPGTQLVYTETCAKQVPGGIVLHNGEAREVAGIRVEAIPAYNMLHRRENGQPFHPQGEGNGYVLTLGKTRLYVAGDTENTPEMKALKDIDVAFLPMNLPYTMTPEMVADAAKAFRPRLLYPYHFGETDTSKLVDLLKDEKDIEVRIRRMA
jgi:L-ascorbate metabolism protein UlaG (beta-lactamase superfamily)